MKKTEMLKKNYEFRKVMTKGKYYSGKNIESFIIKNNKNINFLGLAIGVKKGKAVSRNRVKRLIRESYYKHEEKIKIGNSIVFLWKKNIPLEGITLEEINKDICNIFTKSKNLLEENKEK